MPAAFASLSNWLPVAISALAAGFAGWQIMQSRKQATDEFNWRKKERAVSYSVFKNPEYQQARGVVSTAFGSLAQRNEPVPIEEINRAKAKDPKLSKSMLLVISHWGRMATEIELGLIDEEAAYRYHATALTNVFLGLSEFIHERNSKNPLGNPDLLVVGNRWLERRNGL